MAGVFGILVKNAMGGYPKKPKVPNAPNVDPQLAQQRSIAGNQAALPGLETLSSDVNEFNTAERQKNLETAIPGYSKLTTGESNLLQGWLSGQISPDVAAAVRRNANVRSFAGGYGGSGMADNLQARDLGLTSLDLQKAATGAMPGYLATVNAVGMPRQYDPTMAFLSPENQIAAEQWNEQNRYGQQWLVNQLKAIPDPYKAALAEDAGKAADWTFSQIPYAGMGYSQINAGESDFPGGGGGGGGGGGMGGGGMDFGSIMSMFGGGGGGGMMGGGGGGFSAGAGSSAMGGMW